MKKLIFWGLVAGAGYIGYRAWQTGALDAAINTGSAGEEDAYRRYVASDAYRTSPANMRLSHDAFVRAWRAMPASARPQILRSFSMTQQQVMQETITNPAFRDALAQATAAWGGVSGLGNYTRN